MKGSIHVLQIDDEPDFVELAADMLEREDARFTVETATSASEAMDRLAVEGFDCIVSDYDMPGQNGIEFLTTVRETHPDIPFILFTGKGSETVASEAISAGVTDYLQKQTGADQYTLLANRVANAVERYRGQKQLVEARDSYRTLFDEMNEGGALHELITNEAGEPIDYELLDVNRAFESILGIPKESAKGKRATDLYETEDPPYLERYASVAQTGDSIEFETYYPGLEKYFHIAAFSPAQGQFATLFLDITELKERERNLERFKNAVEHAGHAVYVTDDDGTIEYVNQAFETITGYTADEAVGRNPRILKSGEMSDAYYEELWETVLDGTVWKEEVINRRQDGELYYAHQTIAPILDENDDIGAFVAIQTDITERKEREEAIESSRNAYQDLFHGIKDAVLVHEPTGKFMAVNEAACDRLGYSEDELLELSPEDIDAPEYAEYAPDQISAIEKEGTLTFESVHVAKSGERIPVEIASSSIQYFGKDAILSVARDITERKQKEQELERQNERLDQFASVVSHDLRNPLNVAQGWLELAQEECESTHLADVAQAHDRMEALIEDLLTLARTGTQIDEQTSVDLADVIDGCWRTVETGDATLVTETDRTIRADPNRLQQLLENLFRNAVEHGDPAVTITVGDLDDGNGFYVSDNGPGISDPERDNVFEAGYSTKDKGTGFGLNIVQEIADAHGWGIAVTDSERGGARFEITSVDFAAE